MFMKIKIFFLSVFSIYLVACSSAPVPPTWDKISKSKEVAINKNLHELEKELGNKNTF